MKIHVFFVLSTVLVAPLCAYAEGDCTQMGQDYLNYREQEKDHKNKADMAELKNQKGEAEAHRDISKANKKEADTRLPVLQATCKGGGW